MIKPTKMTVTVVQLVEILQVHFLILKMHCKFVILATSLQLFFFIILSLMTSEDNTVESFTSLFTNVSMCILDNSVDQSG